MDRISPEVEPALASAGAPPSRLRGTAVKVTVSSVPWLIIGGLLWAGLFIKPQPVGGTVQPPVLERRDHFYGISRAPAEGIWVAGSHGKIVAVDAQGKAQLLQTPTDQTLQDIAVWDGGRGVAVGNEGVVLTTADAGRRWTNVEGVPRSEVANKLTRVRIAAEGKAVATGEMGALLYSKDYGASWTRLRDEEDVAWNDAALLPGGGLVVVGEFGRILVSPDGGSTWQTPDVPVESSLMAVAFRNASEGVAVGLEGVVLTTRDGGRSWQREKLDTQAHLFDVAWDEANQRWLGAGALGTWIKAGAAATDWQSGRLDERDLAWHTRVLPVGGEVWLTGANIGRWDGQRWLALGR